MKYMNILIYEIIVILIFIVIMIIIIISIAVYHYIARYTLPYTVEGSRKRDWMDDILDWSNLPLR